jgi:dolichol kinase
MPATLRHELARKGIHLASSAVPVAYALGLARPVVLAALGAAGLVAVGIEITRRRSARARRAFDAAVGPLLRAHERDRWSGATWMCAAYALAVLAFPRRAAVAAMLAVSVGDAAAAVVGRAAGARRARAAAAGAGAAGATRAPAGGGADAPAGAKTWEGSAACAAATALAALLVARLPAAAALACGLAAALAERPRWPIDDNVRVAAAAGGAAWAAAWAARARA